MSIKFPAVLLFAALAISMISAFSLIDDAAAEIISVQNIEITGPTEITVTFSEDVKVKNDGSQFVDLVLSTAPGERNVNKAKEVNNNATVWKLTFVGGDAKPSDTATIDIGRGETKITSSTNETNKFVGINDKKVADGQMPALITTKDRPVLFTGPNEMTIEFTESVTATKDHFSDLEVEKDVRKITSVDGSGTAKIVLTFDGDTVDLDQKEGKITIGKKIIDGVGNTIIDGAGNTLKQVTKTGTKDNSFDGQIPYLISASIVDPSQNENQIELVFSENIRKIKGDLKDYFTFSSGSEERPINSATDPTAVGKDGQYKLTLTSKGTLIGVDATGTIDITAKIVDQSDNPLAPLDAALVKAAQRPLLVSAKLIDSETIELVFSEKLKKESIIETSFTDLNLSSTSNTGFTLNIGNHIKIILKLDTAVVDTDVTGTLYITSHLKDTADKTFVGATVVIEDAQEPTLENIMITDPNTITATFSEPVTATADQFTDFKTDGKEQKRSITNIDGSGTSTIVLTFDGDSVDGDAKGEITLGSKITDLSTLKNIFESAVDNKPRDVADGQSPTVEWAGITNEYEFTINFSEDVMKPTSLKSVSAVHLDQLGEDRQILRINYDKDDKDILVVKFSKSGSPASATETGSVVINAISDLVGNVLVPLKQELVAAQSPLLLSASIEGPQEVKLVFSEEVKALASAFGALNLDDGTQVQIKSFAPVKDFSKEYTLTTNDSLDTAASGSITITAGLYDNDNPVRYFVEGTHTVSDKQSPTLSSASITGSNTITATFSEPVKATPDDFTLLEINNDLDRSITDVSGSGTAEIMLTFNGTAVSTDAKGSIKIAATDLASNPFKEEKTTVTDGQAPLVKRAEVNNGKIEIAYSESIKHATDSYKNIVISGTSHAASTVGGDASLYTITVTPKAAGFGTMDISGVNDTTAGNTIVATTVKIYPDAVPTIESAQATNTHEIILKFSEPVTVDKADITANFTADPKIADTVDTIDGDGTSTITLNLDPLKDKIPLLADGTIDFNKDTFKDLVGKSFANTTISVTAAQVPMLTSIMVTGGNEITIVYSKNVITDKNEYTDLALFPGGHRNVVSVAGSGTNTIELTFDGSAVSTDASAVISIANTVVDSSTGNKFKGADDMPVPAGQKPVLTGVSIASDNPNDVFATMPATVNNTITLSFTASERVSDVKVSIAGNSTKSIVNMVGNDWTATRVMETGDPEGLIEFTIDFKDNDDRAGDTVVATTDDTYVYFRADNDFSLGDITGLVYVDANNNGMQDNGETGLADVTIIAVARGDTDDSSVSTAATDASGRYAFVDVGIGEYLVQIVPFPSNHEPSGDYMSYATTTLERSTTNTVNFGLLPITDENAAVVTGKVFNDANDDSIPDANEDGFANVSVFVVDFLTLTQTTVTTDSNGYYNASGIIPDLVLVQMAPVPVGFMPSTNLTSYSFQSLNNGATHIVNFPVNEVTPEETGVIIINVFHDQNANGVKDSTEPPVSGATVFTYELLTAKPDVQVTDLNGATTHSGLIPDVILAQINASLLPAGFTTITTSNGGAEFITVTSGSTTTVEIGLGN